MIIHRVNKVSRRQSCKGSGLLNSVINKLPFELHLPGYQYCGPGTKLQKRLARGDPGTNPLDQACKEHDIAYSLTKDIKERNIADIQLAEKAWNRVKASDTKLGERASAWLITNIMKTKAKLGMGMKQKNGKIKKKKGNKRKRKTVKKGKIGKRNILRTLMTKTRADIKAKKPENLKSAIKIALAAARKNVKEKKMKRKELNTSRAIPIPKSGGVLPFLVPLFAGLSALGSMGSGVAAIAKAVNEAKQARKQLDESQRHNNTMEAIAMGKGLYLKPYKKGLGLYLRSKNF